MTPLQQRFLDAIESQTHDISSKNSIRNASIACESIAEEFAADFLDWFFDKVYYKDEDGLFVMTNPREKLNTKEAIQQFKDQGK